MWRNVKVFNAPSKTNKSFFGNLLDNENSSEFETCKIKSFEKDSDWKQHKKNVKIVIKLALEPSYDL